MGRKSAAKQQSRSSSDTPTPEDPQKSSTTAMTLAVIAVAVVIGAFAYLRTGSTPADAATAAASAPPVQAQAEPTYAKYGPHKQKELPPLPFQAYAPPRPPEVVRAAYIFAAEHPEILGYIPCFCGCERAGHKGNDDCFVKSRSDTGDVIEWEPHGLECTVCLDVANDARQMFSSGASVRDIRAAIEKKWAAQSAQTHTHTPTPQPPAKP